MPVMQSVWIRLVLATRVLQLIATGVMYTGLSTRLCGGAVSVETVSWLAEPNERRTRRRWGTLGQTLDGNGTEVESTPRRERSPSQHLGVRESSQHLDGSGVRVNTSEYGSRVNTSTGAESESTPRRTESRVNTSTGAESESTTRITGRERIRVSTSENGKSSQHLDRSVFRVSTSENGIGLAFESAPRSLGKE